MSFYHGRALSALSLSILFGMVASHSASASSARQFMSLCAKNHCEHGLTLDRVQADPASYVGHVFELSGTVTCRAETSADIMISLSLSGNSAVMLDIPATETEVLRSGLTSRLRVLVRVGKGGSGNVTPLDTLAVADDYEVATLEREGQAHAAALARSETLREQELARWHARALRAGGRSFRSDTVARGGFSRGPSGVAGGAQAQAAVYSPSLPDNVRECFVPYFNFIAQRNSRLDSRTVGQITFHLLRYASESAVDPRLIVAMIVAESDFDPYSTSSTGAMGLGQLMPGTAQGLGLNNAYDVEQNLRGAIMYLREQLDTFSGPPAPDGTLSPEQVRLAMAAYNAGPNAVKKYGGVPPYRETQAYVRRVESLYRQLCS